MKLLYCPECATAFNLAQKRRTCDCGLCGGQYLDEIAAEYYGPAVVFCIGNTSFLRAEAMQDVLDCEGHSAIGAPFDAFIIPANAPTVKKLAAIEQESHEKRRKQCKE